VAQYIFRQIIELSVNFNVWWCHNLSKYILSQSVVYFAIHNLESPRFLLKWNRLFWVTIWFLLPLWSIWKVYTVWNFKGKLTIWSLNFYSLLFSLCSSKIHKTPNLQTKYVCLEKYKGVGARGEQVVIYWHQSECVSPD
jgi:hypothetical protein